MQDSREITLLSKIQNGDVAAFHQLYRAYFQRLYSFARKFVSEEQAKDVVQDCFFNFWQNCKKTKINTSVSAYLFTVVKNSCYKLLKHERKRNFHEHTFGQKLKHQELDYFIHSESSILEFDVKDRIQKMIQDLPEKCRDVFTASRFSGLTNNEIAEKNGVSVKTVEKHISKALQLFREEFRDIILLMICILSCYVN